MQDLYQKVKDHFSRYTSADVVYDAGGVLFLSESAAESYGKGPVEAIRRNNIESLNATKQEPQSLTTEEIETTKQEPQSPTTEEIEATKQEPQSLTTEEIEATKQELQSPTTEEIEAMTYSQLKSKVAELGIVAEDKKKETLKEALLTFAKQQ